jgi:hypothetical protein
VVCWPDINQRGAKPGKRLMDGIDNETLNIFHDSVRAVILKGEVPLE